MDLVYVVRPGERNEELRYSLRAAAANLPHDRVFIVGHTPEWVRDVTSLQTIQGGTKYANSTRNVLTACCTDEISDPFILMNDDFFVTAPVQDIPALHRGPIVDVIADYTRRVSRPGPYLDGMQATLDLLHELGYEQPFSYELHVPLVIDKDLMRKAIEVATTAGLEVPHKRSLYGNLAQLGGQQVEDVKVIRTNTVNIPEPFASTNDASFTTGWIGRRIAANYQKPSRYEATKLVAR